MISKFNNSAELAKFLRTAGDNNRLRILCVLFRNSDMCVSEIASELNLSVASVSHHLRSLASAGLLKSTKKGKEVCYFMEKSSIMTDLKKFICKYKNN